MLKKKKVFHTKTGQKYTIRDVKAEDAEEIIALINEVGSEKIYLVIEKFAHPPEWEQNYIESLDPEKSLYILAEMNRKIIGMLSLDREKYNKLNHTAILGMVILKKYRNIGVGASLLYESITWAKAKGIQKIYLSCFSTNLSAIALYKKFGFIEEGRRKNQFKLGDRFVDEVMMALWI